MFVLVGALLLFGVVLGAVVHVPPPVALGAAAVIACWLGVYALRKRHAHGRGHS